jgi:hypothetical protein
MRFRCGLGEGILVSRLWSSLIFAGWVGLSMTGCVTGMFGGPTVTERSKEKRPLWTDLEPGRYHNVDGSMQFHDTRTRLADLPIGIKTTQIQTLEASEKALQVELKRLIEEIATDQKIGPLGVSPELDGVIIAETKRFHSSHVKVADLYYEKLEDDSGAVKAEFYTAHVLVQYPTQRRQDLLIEVGKSLQKSRDPVLRRIGVALGTPKSS